MGLSIKTILLFWSGQQRVEIWLTENSFLQNDGPSNHLPSIFLKAIYQMNLCGQVISPLWGWQRYLKNYRCLWMSLLIVLLCIYRNSSVTIGLVTVTLGTYHLLNGHVWTVSLIWFDYSFSGLYTRKLSSLKRKQKNNAYLEVRPSIVDKPLLPHNEFDYIRQIESTKVASYSWYSQISYSRGLKIHVSQTFRAFTCENSKALLVSLHYDLSIHVLSLCNSGWSRSNTAVF